MAGWTKGPKCGVLNCPSRLWTVIDGRRVCKNGHVAEEAQVVSDDDELRGYKRTKFSQSTATQQISEEPTRLVGMDSLKAVTETYATLLREQVAVVQRIYRLPPNIEHTARFLFIKYANSSKLSPQSNSNYTLDMPGLICILGLSLAINNVPVYFTDLIRLINNDILPYRYPYSFLESAYGLKMALDTKGPALSYYSTPSLRKLCYQASTICQVTAIKPPHQPTSPLVYKLVRSLMLPPAVYQLALGLVKISLSRQSSQIFNIIERECVISVCIATKALYRIYNKDPKIMDGPDWNAWADMMLKVWVFDERPENMDTRDALYWDERTVNTLLRAYQSSVAKGSKNLPLPITRLHNMFPVPDIPESEDIYDLDIHKELMMVLYSSISPDAEPFGEIGSDYVIYSKERLSQWTLPHVIETLYRVCSGFIGMSESLFRECIHTTERLVSNTYRDNSDL